MTLKGSNFILKGDFTMDKINSRRNDGTNGYIPRLKHKRVIKGWEQSFLPALQKQALQEKLFP